MKCSKTVKPTECIARGCALQSAMLLSTFRVAEYNLTETNLYPIKCTWRFLDPKTKAILEDENKTPTIFSTKTSFPQLKSVNFPKDATIECKLFYDPVPLAAKKLLAHYMINRKKPKHEDFKIKLKVRLNHNRMVELGGAELIEQYIKEVEVPVEEPEPKKESKKIEEENKDKTKEEGDKGPKEGDKGQETEEKKDSKGEQPEEPEEPSKDKNMEEEP